ncbi:MAG: hypothetical protein AB1726_16290 [Planctomycetota bacterium]
MESRLVAYLQMRGQRVVRHGELRGPLRLAPSQESGLLQRMARDGLLARVRRGLYLAPSALPLGGAWRPDGALALRTLVEDRGGRYQICGPNAFQRYGFRDQVPARTYAYNDRLSGDRNVGGVALTLIKVSSDRLGDTEEAESGEEGAGRSG